MITPNTLEAYRAKAESAARANQVSVKVDASTLTRMIDIIEAGAESRAEIQRLEEAVRMVCGKSNQPFIHAGCKGVLMGKRWCEAVKADYEVESSYDHEGHG